MIIEQKELSKEGNDCLIQTLVTFGKVGTKYFVQHVVSATNWGNSISFYAEEFWDKEDAQLYYDNVIMKASPSLHE